MGIQRRIRIATDCSGIEAPIQALQQMGVSFSHEWSSDIDPVVRESIRCNYRPRRLYDDMIRRNHNRLPKNIDLYVCGFPCQAFSMLGKREGFRDTRGNLFFECVRTIRACRPKIFVLENVKGLVTHNEGRTFQIMLDRLNELPGYRIAYKILNTMDYNLPQHRERLYIVGIRSNNKKSTFVFPPAIPLQVRATDLLETGITRRTDPDLYRLTEHKQSILDELVRSGKIDSLKKDWFVNLNVSSHTWSGARKDVCPCLLAGLGGNCTYYLTSRRRVLTPREYLRLQGFSDDFRICVPPRMIYKQAGNSMSVNVLEAIFRNCLPLLTGNSSQN